MSMTYAPRRAVIAGALAGLMVTAALPVHAVNIPEGGAVTPGSLFLFHLRVTAGCEGLPMDELEVTLPENVLNPTPESMADWETHIEIPDEVADEAAEEGESEEAVDADAADKEESDLTVIRWDGGELEDGHLLDFGIRARFPDEEDAVLEFPVVQRCGEIEQEFVPTVKLTTRYGQGEISALADSVDQLRADVDTLRADVDEIQDQLGEVNVVRLRDRVEVLEEDSAELDDRVTAVEEVVYEPEVAPAE